jgi:hypothetical protein
MCSLCPEAGAICFSWQLDGRRDEDPQDHGGGEKCQEKNSICPRSSPTINHDLLPCLSNEYSEHYPYCSSYFWRSCAVVGILLFLDFFFPICQWQQKQKRRSLARSLEEGRKKSVNYCRRPNMSRSVRVLKKQMRGHFSPRRRGRRLGRWGRQLGDVLDHILGLCLAQEPQNTKGA